MILIKVKLFHSWPTLVDMNVKPIIGCPYGFPTCGNIVTRNAAFSVTRECGHLLPAVGSIVKANLMAQGARFDMY